MFYHHTKNKGDLGVLKAKVDLTERGFLVLSPESEHSPFDLVAYKDGVYKAIQVKYREVKRGCINVRMENVWSDKQGIHSQEVDKSIIDLFCIYCPQTDKCYYFNPKMVKKHFSIRIDPTKNNQSQNVNQASNFDCV